jgi:acyl-CoA reductase-like NAD-dependent aldehyde dehydrogenase
VLMLVGADWRAGEATIEVRDPQDNSLVGEVPRATLADLEDAIAQAIEGAELSRRLPAHQRIEVLNRTADQVLGRHEEFALTIAREGIKTIREARREVSRCVETLRLSAEEARRITGETIAFDQRPDSELRFGGWIREPVGVVAAVTPFNDPLNLVAHKVGPAIASGNAIIVKPHSATPLSAILLAQAFIAAGLPPRILQVLTGRGAEIGLALVSHPAIDMVTFTGGPTVGHQIARAAAGKKVVLELGANSPVIVLADADLDRAAREIAAGTFSAAGQNCLHVQRILVHHAVADELEHRLATAAGQVRLGDKKDESTDMGPLINEESASRVHAVIEEALQLGGDLLAGGGRRGVHVEPTFVRNMPLRSRLASKELFGPAAGTVRVSSLSEAIGVANSVPLGLHAAIFTETLDNAIAAVRGLRGGAVMVNSSPDYRLDSMPFGGIKDSGIGREGVAFAIREMTTTKVFCLAPRSC